MARKKKQLEFYRDGDKYLVLTGESPKDFKDFLFICFKGDTPASVKEDVVTRDDLPKLTKVADVPDDWADAFEAAGIEMPEVEVVEPPKRRASKRQKQDELVSHLAAGTDLYTAAVVSGVWEDEQPQEVDEKVQQDAAMVGTIIFAATFLWVLWILL